MPEVRENTVNHVYKHRSKYNDNGTADIINILLFTGTSRPGMINHLGNNIVHRLPPRNQRADYTGNRRNESKSDKGKEPVHEIRVGNERHQNIEKGNQDSHFLSPSRI